jgi:hypothetical protein
MVAWPSHHSCCQTPRPASLSHLCHLWCTCALWFVARWPFQQARQSPVVFSVLPAHHQQQRAVGFFTGSAPAHMACVALQLWLTAPGASAVVWPSAQVRVLPRCLGFWFGLLCTVLCEERPRKSLVQNSCFGVASCQSWSPGWLSRLLCGVAGGRLLNVVACRGQFAGVSLSLSVPVSPGQHGQLCCCPGWLMCEGQAPGCNESTSGVTR